MKKLLLLLSIVFSLGSIAQDSTHLRISLLTCAPGNELYSLFGHTAIRVTDSVAQSDVVFNYGTFDFNDPDFYMKFTRGKLDYMLSASTLPGFLYEYQMENRMVTEQVLRLSEADKRTLVQTLYQTLSGPLRYYKYDFLYNNCTSRVRDLLLAAGFKPEKQLVPVQTSFRDMLHQYLDYGAQPWSKLGIDILLGSPIDKKVSITESMFLPDYLMKGVDSSVQSNTGGILQQRIILNNGVTQEPKSNNAPLMVFTLLAVVLMVLSFVKHKIARSVVAFFDVMLFVVTGLLGGLLLFMWFGTDHRACANNYNLLWAMPTHFVAVFFLWKRPNWLRYYLGFCVALYLLLLICWFLLPQAFNIALLPVAALLLQRCWMLRKAA